MSKRIVWAQWQNWNMTNKMVSLNCRKDRGLGPNQGWHKHCMHEVTPCEIPYICLEISPRLLKQNVITLTEVFSQHRATYTALSLQGRRLPLCVSVTVCVFKLLLTHTSAELPGLPSLRSSICRWEPTDLNKQRHMCINTDTHIQTAPLYPVCI